MGAISPITDAVRELVSNGDFSSGLAGWVRFHRDASGGDVGGTPSGSIELVPDRASSGPVNAVQFLRTAEDGERLESGLRQRIGTTLRVHSSLVLDFEVKISDQLPHGGGELADTFPLMMEINYLDVGGAERRWRHGYYVLEDQERAVPDEIATQIDRGEWQRIVFDLRNLDPLPRQITSIVVYASGQRFATRVTNLSLSSTEIIDPEDR
jgi:hypothetical protein